MYPSTKLHPHIDATGRFEHVNMSAGLASLVHGIKTRATAPSLASMTVLPPCHPMMSSAVQLTLQVCRVCPVLLA